MASKNKRKQTFKEEYSRSWDFIKPSRIGREKTMQGVRCVPLISAPLLQVEDST